MKALLLALTLAIAGCSHQPATQPPAQQKPDAAVTTSTTVTTSSIRELTDSQTIALLRQEAHDKHIRWHVYCTDASGEWQFQGDGMRKSDGNWGNLIRNGGPYWSAHAATQIDAAVGLYEALKWEPNLHFDAPLIEASSAKPKCPPELHGE